MSLAKGRVSEKQFILLYPIIDILVLVFVKMVSNTEV